MYIRIQPESSSDGLFNAKGKDLSSSLAAMLSVLKQAKLGTVRQSSGTFFGTHTHTHTHIHIRAHTRTRSTHFGTFHGAPRSAPGGCTDAPFTAG